MMKKNKNTIISAILFLSYDIYVFCNYIYFMLKKDTYGNVYNNILIYPHFAFMIVGTIFNLLAFFIDNKWLIRIATVCYIVGAIFLFL